MVGIDDVLAEQQRRLARIEAVKGRLDPVVGRFMGEASGEGSGGASGAQAALFVAASVERAAGILFWQASSQDRQGEAETYSKAVEQLWGQPVDGDPITSADIEELYELSHFDDWNGKAGGFAEAAATALRAALLLAENGDAEGVREVSAISLNNAHDLGERSSSATYEQEADAQIADIEALLRDSAGDDVAAVLRERARAAARERLELAVAYVNS